MEKMEYGRAICYSGYREGQSPKDCTYPTYDQIVEDLKILEGLNIKYIRMYDAISYAEMTCQVIKDLGLDMKMMLGPGLQSEVNNPGCPWMQTDFSEEELQERAKWNDSRVDKLIEIANKYPDVINIVSIGNEHTPDWGANNIPVERLVSFAKRLREGTGKPVTFNEGAFEWPRIPQIAEQMDVICVHSYPLWHGVSVDEALAENKEWYAKIKETYPDKPVMFSEVGWATKSVPGSQMGENQTNEENQKKYYEELWEWIDEEEIISYVFEAFDEPWKGGKNPIEAEKNWGLYKVDRTPKLVLQ